mgnify:FL=1
MILCEHTLPSGDTLSLSSHLVPDHVELPCGPCPEGHFWYKRFDPVRSEFWFLPLWWKKFDFGRNGYGYTPGNVGLSNYMHAPIPNSVDELRPYMAVIITLIGGTHWKGDIMSEPLRYHRLRSEDQASWDDFLQSEKAYIALRKLRTLCRFQGFIQQDNPSNSKNRLINWWESFLCWVCSSKWRRLTSLTAFPRTRRACADEASRFVLESWLTDHPEVIFELGKLSQETVTYCVGPKGLFKKQLWGVPSTYKGYSDEEGY